MISFSVCKISDSKGPSRRHATSSMHCKGKAELSARCAVKSEGVVYSLVRPVHNSHSERVSKEELKAVAVQFFIERTPASSHCSGNISFTITCDDTKDGGLEYSAQVPFYVSPSRPVVYVTAHGMPPHKYGEAREPSGFFSVIFSCIMVLLTALIILYRVRQDPQKLRSKRRSRHLDKPSDRCYCPSRSSQPQPEASEISSDYDSDSCDPTILLTNGAYFASPEVSFELPQNPSSNAVMFRTSTASFEIQDGVEEERHLQSEAREALVLSMKHGAVEFSPVSLHL